MHDSMDEVFETLEPACKQIDELAGTRTPSPLCIQYLQAVGALADLTTLVF